jgi:hypothetical protein
LSFRWHIPADQFLLTSTLVGFNHFEAIEGVLSRSCIATINHQRMPVPLP